jgi:hypothetical protein
MDDLGVTLADVAKTILIGIGSLTLWLLKKLGDKHIDSVTELRNELKESREEINKRLDKFLEAHHDLVSRVKVIESKLDERD